jgi:hypothetical protein
MWYKQVLAQFGGGVNWPDEKPDQETSHQEYAEPEINKIEDVDNKPAGLYDELAGILEKMGKNLDDYYQMNQEQQKEIWDLLVDRPHRMNMDDNGNYIVSPQSAANEARRHSPYHEAPENTTIESQLEGSRQQNNNRDPQSMASKEKGNGFQHFKSGEGYYQASKGKQDPILFGNKPSNQTWY